jgi:chromosome segregation ATPase
MNSLGKVLVVFVTASSLGFLAFALSLVAGGPNWKNEAESEELTSEFVFSATTGEKPQYSVKTRRTDASVQSQTPRLADAVIAARKKLLDDTKAEETRLNGEIAKIQPMIKEIKDSIPPDKAAMVVRVQMLDKSLDQITAEIETVTKEIAAKAAAIQLVQKTAEERRDEGFRMRNQLELLRTDLFAAVEQQKILEDELVRVEENLKRLERRGGQLQKQVDYDGK